MNMHSPHHSPYLSRNKAREFFGGYSATPNVVNRKIAELFETAREPRIGNFHNQPALIFDRLRQAEYPILLKLEDRFGLITVRNEGPNHQPTIVHIQEFVTNVDQDWRASD